MSLKNNSWCVILFFLSLALFSWLESSYTFTDPDSFYHARMAQMISQIGVVTDFPWQQVSILKNDFCDHHLLYHLIIAPLNNFFDPIISLKIGSIILNSIFIAFFTWYLKKKDIRYFWAYSLMLLTVTPFLIRLSAPKASPLALILLLAGIYFLEQKKYLYLFLISFLYVWSHGGFVLLLVAGIIFYNAKNILSILTGFAAGLMINPYFPQSLSFYWQQLVQIGIINYKDKFAVGAEWYHFYPQDLIGSSYIVWIPLVLAAVIFIRYYKKQDLNNKQWVILFIFFLLATVRSRRFVEYFIPIAIISTALVIDWYLKSRFFSKHYSDFMQSWQKKKFWWSLFFIYLSVVLPLGAVRGLYLVYLQQTDGISISTFQKASEYINRDSQDGDIIFNPSWDEWPVVFYHNQKNYYLIGLDPTFMYNYDTKLFNLWQDLASGKVNNNLAEMIKNNFHTRYIFINKDNENNKLFSAYLARDAKIKKIYSDSEAIIYEIIQ